MERKFISEKQVIPEKEHTQFQILYNDGCLGFKWFNKENNEDFLLVVLTKDETIKVLKFLQKIKQ